VKQQITDGSAFFIWHMYAATKHGLPSDHLLLDRSPNLGPLISRWELEKFENC
jgi:hypothetical protein